MSQGATSPASDQTHELYRAFRPGWPRRGCPGSCCCDETGKPLIQHTYEAAQRAAATVGLVCGGRPRRDSRRACGRFGGRGANDRVPICASGTDRVAEVARRMTDVDIFVNVQGDEPELPGDSIDPAIELLEDNPALVMSHPGHAHSQRRAIPTIRPASKWCSTAAGRAMYFSRSPIPHARAVGRRPADR